MSTFLELTQDTARESGTIATIGDPATFTSISGRLLRIKNWVARAYTDIQNERREWRWLVGEFSGSTVASTQRYSASDMGIASRFADWIPIDENNKWALSIYKTSDGQGTEQFIRYRTFQEFRRLYMSGSADDDTGTPQVYSIDPDQKLVFHPIPDAVFTVRGLYRKGAQTLSAESDTPEMPTQFHEAIMWRALYLLGVFDEAFQLLPEYERNYKRWMSALRDSQIPPIIPADALA